MRQQRRAGRGRAVGRPPPAVRRSASGRRRRCARRRAGSAVAVGQRCRRRAAPAPRSASGVRADSGSTCSGARSRAGRPARHGRAPPRAMTCALVPLKPNELTPARRGASPRGQARPSAATAHRIARPRRCAGSAVVKCRCGGMLLVLQRQDDLDQAGDAGGRLEVADVGLHRADHSGASAARPAPSARGQRLDLDRIAERGAGAVRLDVVDVGRRQPASASAARITASCAGPFGAVARCCGRPG